MADRASGIRKIKEESLLPKEKKIYILRKVSEKKRMKLAAEANAKGDTALDIWFEARRKEMTGRCLFCGSPTQKLNDDLYRRCVAHLLPKRPNMFLSVGTHPDNWLELCFFDNSCHSNFDNGIITFELLADSSEWIIITDKFSKIYPYIALNERRLIPDILLKSLNR